MAGRVAVVAPYSALAELAQQVVAELDLKVEVYTGDLAEGAQVAEQIVAEGIEVIISRGGTATVIAQSLDVPVVEIAVSAFDLIWAINQAKAYGNKIGVVGFRNVIYGTKSLESILGVKIEEIEVKKAEEVPQVIASAREVGVEVIVGDAISVRSSKELGLAAILVNSGKESIGLALREANDLALVRRKERARAEQLKVILDLASEGILATDPTGSISHVNKVAEKILKSNEKSMLGQRLSDVLPGFAVEDVLKTGVPRLNELHKIGSASIVENAIPVLIDQETVGVVATFQDVRELQAVESKVRKELYLRGHVAEYTFQDIVTKSTKMRLVLDQAYQYASSEASILINGETGTGKELVAQSIHNASERGKEPFVAINCAAVPENLLESELFGYEEGAFTGARKGGKKGLFELAHRGTLFLDELGELSLNLQARLLRVLQEKVIRRVGGDRMVPVDVRIVAATHRNLDKAVLEGAFRRDLYYRLNVLPISIPPLRERREDIPLLIERLAQKKSQRTGCKEPIFTEAATNLLKTHHWPGNVRELENIVERLTVLREGQLVVPTDVTEILNSRGANLIPTIQLNLSGTLEEMERKIIQRTLELTGNDKFETCKRLGLSKTTLWRRLKGNQ